MTTDDFALVVKHLSNDFEGVYSKETIARFLSESHEQLQHARVRPFVSLLADRFARERLKANAQAEGTIVKEIPEVLFVCVQNAGRSQMAAVLLDHHAEGRVHVRSAGSAPAGDIHDNVKVALEEVGLDVSKEFPKPLTDEVVRAADVVVTMGCGDACPVYPGKRYIDWELPDPAGQPLESVREIRDEIERRVLGLLSELVPGHEPAQA